MKSEIVVKDNALINASYSLSLVEQRLILLAIVTIREHTHNMQLDHVAFSKPIKITAESYIKTFGVSQSTAYETLKDACKSLFARQFSYKEKREKGTANVTSRWVQKIAYIDNAATVEFLFADDVLPLITFLEKHLTSYELKQVAELTSAYAVRLYELLIAWRSTGKTPEIGLNEFRQKMGVLDTEYPRMDNFKRIVLEPAIKQINEHTDITAEYEQHKQGRSVTGFSFRFKPKFKPKDPIPQRDADTIDMFCNLSDGQIKMYSSILSKVRNISDLAGNKDYQAFAIWIANILRDPSSAEEETAKRIFKALRTETDFKEHKKRDS